MVSIAERNLLHEKGRLAISIAGVGFAIMLILILAGLYDGFQESARAYVEGSGADLFVTQEGTTDMFHSFSILPLNLTAKLTAILGVASVSPLISRQVEIHLTGGHAKAAIVGFEDLGGPWRVIRGTAKVGAREIILDKVLATKDGLDVGSTLKIGETEFKVVGISEGTNFFILQYAFVRFEDAAGLILPLGTTTFLLVQITSGSQADEVAARIHSEVPGTLVFTNEKFAESNAKLVSEAFLPILAVLYAVGGIVGITVIGLTVYTATIEKSKEYGILKAIGGTNTKLFRILLSQALFLALFGFLAGLGLTALAAVIIGYLVPIISLYFASIVFPLILMAALTMGLFASLVPMRKIARVDPAMIFRRG